MPSRQSKLAPAAGSCSSSVTTLVARSGGDSAPGGGSRTAPRLGCSPAMRPPSRTTRRGRGSRSPTATSSSSTRWKIVWQPVLAKAGLPTGSTTRPATRTRHGCLRTGRTSDGSRSRWVTRVSSRRRHLRAPAAGAPSDGCRSLGPVPRRDLSDRERAPIGRPSAIPRNRGTACSVTLRIQKWWRVRDCHSPVLQVKLYPHRPWWLVTVRTSVDRNLAGVSTKSRS